MLRDRIRVRPTSTDGAADGFRPFITPSSLSSYTGETRAVSPQSRVDNAWSAAATSSSLSSNATPEGLGDARSYSSRLLGMATDAVSSFVGIWGRKEADYGASADVRPVSHVGAAPASSVASPAAPPNTPFNSLFAAAPSSFSAAQPAATEELTGDASRAYETYLRPSGSVELRRPRPCANDYKVPDANLAYPQLRGDRAALEQPVSPPPPASVQAPAAVGRASAPFYPAREVPHYQITVNQYFAAPPVNPFPLVTTASEYVASPPRASSQLRTSLLTMPSAVRPHVKRQRESASTFAPPPAMEEIEAPATKAPKTASPTEASNLSLSNAPSAIPVGSPENSLTVPISQTASNPIFGKSKAADEAPAPFKASPAPLAAAKPGDAAPAPLFGAKPSGASASASPFVFGTKPTAPAAASTASAASSPPPQSAAPKFGSFVKPGPPAVMADDDGDFAPGSDDDGEAKKTKPAFSFTSGPSKPTFGASASPAAATPANPFSFSPKAPEKTATPAPALAPKGNSFVKPGPPAVMPDDEGFAPDSDDDGEPKGSKEDTKAPAAPAPAKPLFSFNAAGAAPLFGGAGAPTPASSASLANPFTFGAKSANKPAGTPAEKAAPMTAAPPASPFTFGAKPADKPAEKAAPAPFSGGFVKTGPAAVIPDDSGFAPNADSDDDGDGKAKKTKPDTAGAPSSGIFSFNAAGAKPAFGTGGGSGGGGFSFGSIASPAAPFGASPSALPSTAPSAPAAPSFTFASPNTASASNSDVAPAKPAFGSSAASPFGSSSAAPFGRGASPFVFGKPSS